MEKEIAEERERPMRVWYLSFCEPHDPKGTQFLGACFVWARGTVTAMRIAQMRGCNPGGKVLSAQVPADISIDAKWMNRLLSGQQIAEMDEEMSKEIGFYERPDSNSPPPTADVPISDR